MMLVSRNATKNSKLDFMMYGEDTTSRELIGQATLNLSDVMQKHRSKSEWFFVHGSSIGAIDFDETCVINKAQ